MSQRHGWTAQVLGMSHAITDQPSDQRFGDLLKRYRVAAHLTQEELAERARLSAKAISALERGVNRAPHKETLRVLMHALRLHPHDRSALKAAIRQQHLRERGKQHEQRERSARDFLLYGLHDPVPRTPGWTHLDVDARQSGLRPTQLQFRLQDVWRPAAHFVGRIPELALMGQHLHEAGPPVFFVVGEPGMGKTRLLQEAALRAAAAGFGILEGGCQRWSGQATYVPLLTALETCVHNLSPKLLRASITGCEWIARLLPELGEVPEGELGTPLAPDQERRLMFRAVARFLTNLRATTGMQGLVLLLDDVQWAGLDALALLSSLAGMAATIPLRVFAAYRSTEVSPRAALLDVMSDLMRAGLAVRIELGPLAPEEASVLLSDLLLESGAASGSASTRRSVETGQAIETEQDAQDRSGASVKALGLAHLLPEHLHALLQRTGGVPFFLVSCAQELRHAVARTSAYSSADTAWNTWEAAWMPQRLAGYDGQERVCAGTRVPWMVTQSIRQRVDTLPKEAQHLLAATAVVGGQITLAVWYALGKQLQQSKREAQMALDAVCAARLLVADRMDPEIYHFAHDLIREAIEADLGPGRRMMLSQIVADALEEVGNEDRQRLLYAGSLSARQSPDPSVAQ